MFDAITLKSGDLAGLSPNQATPDQGTVGRCRRVVVCRAGRNVYGAHKCKECNSQVSRKAAARPNSDGERFMPSRPSPRNSTSRTRCRAGRVGVRLVSPSLPFQILFRWIIENRCKRLRRSELRSALTRARQARRGAVCGGRVSAEDLALAIDVGRAVRVFEETLRCLPY